MRDWKAWTVIVLIIGLLIVVAILNVQDMHERKIKVALPPPPQPSEEVKAASHFKYFKDQRTGICFAGAYNSYNTFYILTRVPCTSEVEKLIEPLP